VRGHTADTNVTAAQNFLPDKRDHDGVINIVICGVAGRDIFKSKLSGKADHARIVGLHRRVCSFVHRPKFADEGFYNYQCRVEHVNRPCFAHIEGADGPNFITQWQ
jgi:hypothetical protein